jgi:DNA-binding transcriptional regulator YiaG
MQACGRCRREKVVPVTLDDTMDVSGHTFEATLPATRCLACGEVIIQGHDMRLFELRVAIELAKAGLRSAESFRFLRNSLQLETGDLADLLDVPKDFIDYWERGEWPVDPRAHAVVCSLVMGKYDQAPAALDCLKVLREPRKLARKVRVELIGALERATKAFQFGSSARTTPALA